MSPPVTRLAPSPTGALHLGNARTFLVNWLLARQRGWRVVLRIEDLDGPRVKPEAVAETLDVLAWLGLTWDGPVVYQSQRHAAYARALAALVAAGTAYPCVCSRKDIDRAATAPHAEDATPTYPGTCRGKYASAQAAEAATGRAPAWRVGVPDEPVAFDDAVAGPQRFDLRRHGGDFVIFRKQNLAAYQLAVVVDDAEAGVDEIVRGDDLLDSAARQIHLRRLLGLGEAVRWWHLPLVLGPDGRRLAKRHGDTRLTHYRDLGAPPERLCGLLGFWCGALERRRPSTPDELLERFDIARLPREPVTFTDADDAFCRA
ncbi:MAG: tRNA glutamyl-Q(34) synthetase GluQRS [Phycisphaerae bacterium]|nr:tRNA glutamyl-Q(34) synthetase GluQRS [Phycisphaerae bacterium]